MLNYMEDSKPLYKQKSFLRLDIDIINENDKKIKYKKNSGFVNDLRNTVKENKNTVKKNTVKKNKKSFVNKLRNLVKQNKIEN